MCGKKIEEVIDLIDETTTISPNSWIHTPLFDYKDESEYTNKSQSINE